MLGEENVSGCKISVDKEKRTIQGSRKVSFK